MNKIIGRDREQLELANILDSKKAEFVVVYGRRRVGKTYLITNFYQSKPCTFFYAVGLRKGSMRTQIANFSKSIAETFFNGIPIQTQRNWNHAFETLTTILHAQSRDQKIVLFLDELPWMATNKSMLLQSIDYYWNKYWSHMSNVKVVVCGSSASWLIKKIINDQGGLHNRVTRQIILKPFDLTNTNLYLKYLGCKYNADQLLELYMALGGIPFYLSNINKNISAAQNINNLCFREDGVLFDEFDKLFTSLFKNAAAYIEIIRIIAKKHYGVARSEIESEAKLSSMGGTLTERLQNLETAGFISCVTPFSHDVRGTMYRVIDEFCMLHLNWIEAYKKDQISKESESNYWIAQYKTPAWNSWAGYAFESICYKHIAKIRKALHISDSYHAAPWNFKAKSSSETGAQIDLVIDRHDGSINICEIKYAADLFEIDKAYKDNLINKIEVFRKNTKTKKQIFIVMITTHGIKPNHYAEEYVNQSIVFRDLVTAEVQAEVFDAVEA